MLGGGQNPGVGGKWYGLSALESFRFMEDRQDWRARVAGSS
jgi:hypothetical protein